MRRAVHFPCSRRTGRMADRRKGAVEHYRYAAAHSLPEAPGGQVGSCGEDGRLPGA